MSQVCRRHCGNVRWHSRDELQQMLLLNAACGAGEWDGRRPIPAILRGGTLLTAVMLTSLQLTLWGDFVTTPGNTIQQEVEQGQHPIIAVSISTSSITAGSGSLGV